MARTISDAKRQLVGVYVQLVGVYVQLVGVYVQSWVTLLVTPAYQGYQRCLQRDLDIRPKGPGYIGDIFGVCILPHPPPPTDSTVFYKNLDDRLKRFLSIEPLSELDAKVQDEVNMWGVFLWVLYGHTTILCTFVAQIFYYFFSFLTINCGTDPQGPERDWRERGVRLRCR